jgi:uncharacterized protein (TIGR00369 family)
MVALEKMVETWTLEHIRDHIEQGLPLVPLFNIDVIEASPVRCAVRLREGQHITRPGGSIAGPVQFALADVASYALILADRRDEYAVTVDLMINFLRPAMHLPLLAVATPLRGRRRLYTADIRIQEEASGRLVAQAAATYALSLSA